jgi:hypothetical protein
VRRGGGDAAAGTKAAAVGGCAKALRKVRFPIRRQRLLLAPNGRPPTRRDDRYECPVCAEADTPRLRRSGLQSTQQGLEKVCFSARCPAGTQPSAGDIAYYAPWGNLAIFHRDFRYSDGLIGLGRFDGGLEVLKRPGPLTARFELVAEGLATSPER